MKKCISLILVGVLLLSLCACQGNFGKVNLQDTMMIPEDVVFDVKVKAQKASSFARLTQNETVLELYRLGFFAPERADQALIALDAMDFEGRDAIIRAVRSQGTLQQQNARLTRQMHKMAQVIDAQNGSTIAQSMQEEGMV